MRGYFDALLRATGVGAGATGRAMTHRPPGVVELDQETRAETMAPRAAQTTDRLETRPTRERTSEFEPSPQAPITRAAAITPAAPAPQATRVERVAQRPPVEPAAARAETMTADEAPDLGQAMVRAAMRWVAADAVAQQVGASVAHAPAHTREVIAPREVDATPRRQRLGDDLPSQRIGHTEAASVVPDATARPATTTPAMIPVAPLSPAPVARNEIVEVSIGAIHVRVDAPAVQAVQSPQAPPAAPRATVARPQRSALSRRALRRI